MNSPLNIDNQDLVVCKSLQKRHGKSYYFATGFFPKELREATYVLYAFFRVPDELVDNPDTNDPQEIMLSLERWRLQWKEAFDTGVSDHPVLRASVAVFKHYAIPYEYSDAFLTAMIQDTQKARYKTYEELEQYMYGSAAVVGLMMSYVIGFEDKAALGYAKKLGYAMQLTNFLRDIQEDIDKRNRIYMPVSELEQFGLSEEDITEHRYSSAFRDFMQWQCERAHALYEEADTGIALLHPRGQRAVRTASVLYREILNKIAEQEYNIFAGRAHTSTFEKIRLALRI